MTVADLIQKLQALPPTAEVLVQDDGSYQEPNEPFLYEDRVRRNFLPNIAEIILRDDGRLVGKVVL